MKHKFLNIILQFDSRKTLVQKFEISNKKKKVISNIRYANFISNSLTDDFMMAGPKERQCN